MPNNPSTPGQGIDTGTGGFPVGDNDERLTYDVGSDVGDDSNRPAWSPGDVKVDNTPRDLSKGTRITLSSYLSRTTLGQTPSSPSSVANRYPIDHAPTEQYVESGLKDSKGYPVPPAEPVNTSKYVPSKKLSSRSSADVNLKFLRGRQEGDYTNQPDGNTLLRNATPDMMDEMSVNPSAYGGKLPKINTVDITTGNPIKDYYGNPKNISNSVIYNRFNSENKYETFSTSQPLRSGQFAKQYEYGTSEAERDMTYGRLAQVGSMLTLRSTSERGSGEPNVDPNSIDASSIGVAQLGVTKINRDELYAESVIKDLTTNEIPDAQLISPAGDSWGSLNNPGDVYSGVSNFGMQTLATALIAALAVAITALALLLSVGGAQGANYSIQDVYGRKPYGAFRWDGTVPLAGETNAYSLLVSILSGKFSLWRLLGFTPTVNPPAKTIPTGALFFFGIEQGVPTSIGEFVGVAIGASKAASESSGYYTIMARNMNRSFIQIGEAFSGLQEAFSKGLFAGVDQIFEILSAIRKSKFVKSLDFFSQNGDRLISQLENPDSVDFAAIGPGKKFKSKIDHAPVNSALKSRLAQAEGGISRLTLGWASYRSPDLLIVPAYLKNLTLDPSLNPPSFNLSIPASTTGGFKNGRGDIFYESDTSRIPTSVRENIEKSLEAEYVPFYFHDVRTNEIISFHAFLASLTDDYTANYDSLEAFGRVEAIKVYKSTARKISLSFHVVSTNRNDYDVMWLKLNKLSTLVYPQFGEGRKLVDDKYSLHAPFSQTIQASPLVRLRVGDLIKSNYTKFNLARLFGYSYEDTVFDGKKLPPKGRSEGTRESESEVLKRVQNEKGSKFLVPPETPLAIYPESVVSFSGKFEDNTKNGFIYIDQIYTSAGGLNTVYEVIGRPEEKDGGVGTREPDVEDEFIDCIINYETNPLYTIPQEGTSDETRLNAESDLIIDQFTKPSFYKELSIQGNNKALSGQKVRVHRSHLTQPTPPTQNKYIKYLRESRDIANSAYSKRAADFMDDSDLEGAGNAIVQSFKSVGGKGLAGFIDSISFDWYNQASWEVDEGRKAPMNCKVTISFSPIHDIAPGLDHKGHNRAPLYNIRKLTDYDKGGNNNDPIKM
jgi:hypothetical protein